MNITVRPLREDDLQEADRILRLAFGTFLGLPDPASFTGDASYVHTRWRADPMTAFAADADGQLAGSTFVSRWGSVGFLGPLTTRPDLWDRGIGKRLMDPVMACFEKWGTRHAGLFTFAHSQKHVGLYQKFGFWPRFLTAVMSKAVGQARRQSGWTAFSGVPGNQQDTLLRACTDLTDRIYPGLEVTPEVRSVNRQKLGETILLWKGDRLAGLAVCHCGPGSEAGSGVCYVKFGAVAPGPSAEEDFDRLLDACEQLAASQGLSRLVAGGNAGRDEAYRRMLGHGFRADMQGVAMQRSNDPGYNRPGVYVMDDWR
jgi:GNAT superfamily N-acetyltransferase